jgi:hypothetical protein
VYLIAIFSAARVARLALGIISSSAVLSAELVLVEEDRSTWFPWSVSALAAGDSPAGFDLSWLNAEPAGAHGPLRADGERLVDGRGREVRLFGSNICDWHAVMPREYAEPVARRLKELGVNFIRLHYFDFETAPIGIFAAGQDGLRNVDPEMLDRLHFLVARLKAHGIYSDINLHVARRYPGQPEGWHAMGKGLDKLHRPFIEMQKEYARQLLAPVNPYTGLALKDDPAVAIIEFNNENTSLGFALTYAALPAEFSAPLAERWNAWLAARYPSDADLARAWQPPQRSRGKEILPTTDFAEAGGLGAWKLEASNGGEASAELHRLPSGERVLRWDISKAGREPWGHQLHLPSVPVRDGEAYVLELEARADTPRKLSLQLRHQQPSWNIVGGPVEINVTSEWQRFRVALPVNDPTDSPTRLSLDALNQATPIELREVSLRAGTLTIPADQLRLADRAVPLPSSVSSRAQMRDFLHFLADQEIAYGQEMRRLVKEELSSRALVFDSQADYGGLHGLAREATVGDMLDTHHYPDHPSQDGAASSGDARVWRVKNRSQVGKLRADSGFPAFTRLSGRPFGMSEYDLNPPNDHAAEAISLYSVLGAFQGWSMLAEYAWLNFQTDYNPSAIHSAYSTTGHAAQMAAIPAAALVFRLGLVETARGRAEIELPREGIAEIQGSMPEMKVPTLADALGLSPYLPWVQGVGVKLVPGTGEAKVLGAPSQKIDPSKQRSDTGELNYETLGEQGHLFTADSPRFGLVIGQAAGAGPLRLGGRELTVAKGPRADYVHASLVAPDGQPIAKASRLLFTLFSRVENRGARYTEDRSTVGPSFGAGPTLFEPVDAELSLPPGSWIVRPLAGDGSPGEPVRLESARLSTTAVPRSVWYLLEKNPSNP